MFLRYKHLFILPILFFLAGCETEPKDEAPIDIPKKSAGILTYTVTNTYPHDTELFTEGLLFHQGKLLESTGSPETQPSLKSMIGISDLKTGKFTKKIEIDKSIYFGEGIAVFKNTLYQLTYTTQKGFIYDATSFKAKGTFTYTNKEGWGMTSDSNHLIMTDGTNQLTYLHPETLQPIKTLAINDEGFTVQNLNEIEFINGYLYANIWTTNYIVKIDPSTGNVVAKMDLNPIANEIRSKNPEADVLNGIAFNPENNKLYVTGKLWPTIYELSFTP
jgi:glutamine cyclotransferase